MFHLNEYEISLFDMTDDQLVQATKDAIFLSSRYASVVNSHFHLMCDACFDACQKRSPDLYKTAYALV